MPVLLEAATLAPTVVIESATPSPAPTSGGTGSAYPDLWPDHSSIGLAVFFACLFAFSCVAFLCARRAVVVAVWKRFLSSRARRHLRQRPGSGHRRHRSLLVSSASHTSLADRHLITDAAPMGQVSDSAVSLELHAPAPTIQPPLPAYIRGPTQRS
ncbi:hypothetical protein EXIGLDRAFT_729697 [Exidia glandulosa HHB12029]|uniref:Uncharacterized protein n=1 Tax=Exidia glandulosa HHB12029 TaxID=1314781 RepID=A0A165CHJ1_EXIGL|nr:hypothetical protein EXIGLDRAFT_729697 [Exidia glandulosa HHB12029]